MKKEDKLDNLVSNDNLVKKLNYILSELNMNKAEFLRECQKYNPSMSKPTVINMFKENNNTRLSIVTLATIIKVCEESGNERLSNVSFNYLLSDNDYSVNNNTILNDEVVERLGDLCNPVAPDVNISIVNDFLYNTDAKYWNFLYMKKCLVEVQSIMDNLLNKRVYTKEYATKLNRFIYLIDNKWIREYLSKYFSNIDCIVKDIIRLAKWEDVKLINERIKELNEVIFIFVQFVENTLQDLTKELYKKIEENEQI